MKKFILGILVLAALAAVIVLTDKQKEPIEIGESPKVEQKDNSDKNVPVKEPEKTEEVPEKVEVEPNEDSESEVETPAVETPASDKEDADSSEGNSRPQNYYVEELILNFSNLYPAVVNKDNIDFSVLDNVIMPDSEFNNYISKQVADYKEKKTEIDFITFDIESVKDKDKDSFEVVVNQVITTTVGGKTEEKSEKAAYIVQFTKDRMGIAKLIIKN
jgi:hypothetical protein